MSNTLMLMNFGTLKSKVTTIGTLWKIHNFFTQKLREIKVPKCHFNTNRGSEVHLFEFLHFLKVEIYQKQTSEPLIVLKMAVLQLIDSPKLISRKI